MLKRKHTIIVGASLQLAI